MHLAYIWIVSHLSAKNYRNLWKFDEVLTKTNLLSFLGHGVDNETNTDPQDSVHDVMSASFRVSLGVSDECRTA